MATSQMLIKTHLIIDADSIKWKVTGDVLKIGTASERTGRKIEITSVRDCNLIKKSPHTLELLIQTSQGSNLTVDRHQEEYIKIICTAGTVPQATWIGKRPRPSHSNAPGAKKLKLIDDEDNKIIVDDPTPHTVVLINDHRTYNTPLLVDATIKITDQDDSSEEDDESDEELDNEKSAYLSDISDLIDDEDEESRESEF